MKLKFSCVNCGEELILTLENNEVTSVEINLENIVCKKEIAEILKNNNIEIG